MILIILKDIKAKMNQLDKNKIYSYRAFIEFVHERLIELVHEYKQAELTNVWALFSSNFSTRFKVFDRYSNENEVREEREKRERIEEKREEIEREKNNKN